MPQLETHESNERACIAHRFLPQLSTAAATHIARGMQAPPWHTLPSLQLPQSSSR